MEKQIETLKVEMSAVEKERDHYKNECDKLNQELKALLEIDIEERKIEKPQNVAQSIADFKTQPGGATSENIKKFDIIEAKGHLTILQKKNAALQISLKAVEMELKSKTMLESQKSKLVDLLDCKIAKIQAENSRLLEKQEQQKKDGNSENADQSKATVNGEGADQSKQAKINELEEKLFCSERILRETKKANTELKKMLADLEDKGKKLMTLAKEKVIGYNEQNKNLKSDMDILNKKVADGEEQLKEVKDKLETARKEKNFIVQSRADMEQKLDTLAESIVNKEETNMEMMNEVLKIRETLARTEEERLAAEYTDKFQSLQDENKKLSENVEASQNELKKVMTEKSFLDDQMKTLKAVLNPNSAGKK